jgi:hypothetical protein
MLGDEAIETNETIEKGTQEKKRGREESSRGFVVSIPVLFHLQKVVVIFPVR